jgi:hypothetical protein
VIAVVHHSLLAWVLLTAPALASDWTTRFHEDGVKVQTREVESSRYHAFLATTTLPAAPEAVLKRLRDIDSYTQWFPDTPEARQVFPVGASAVDDTVWFNYLRTDVPWPVKDRDTVYRNRLVRRDDGLRVEIVADPDVVPETRRVVRIRKASGFWHMHAVDGGTAVRWEFHLDPGGNISPALANARVLETPKGALRALRRYFGG